MRIWYNDYIMTNPVLQSFQSKLKEHKALEEERLMGYLSEKYNIPVVQIESIQVNPDALQLIKEKDAREAGMAILKRIKGKLTVAVNEPNNPNLKKILSELDGRGYSHELTLASTKTLEQIWGFYKDIVATSATTPGTLLITNTNLEEIIKNIQSIEAVRDLLSEVGEMQNARKISKNIEYIAATAIAINASDIHIEPVRDGGIVRYRIDGVLTDVITLPKKEYKQLITRMKLVSHMKITTKGAQDGGFVIHLSDRIISVRSSVIPEEEGGSFVVRLLDPKNVMHDVAALGIHPTIMEVFQKHIKRPNGLVLVTGPTGSGKTTTLYSFLKVTKSAEVKVITLEDPIEYRLEGVVQTQIDKNYSFALGLRAILRQDPDIILVGEMRDNEVAEIGVQAALTGHLVFSTLHTNDALGALHRLAQLEIDPQNFARAINIIIAQRLVRILCPKCSEKHVLNEQQEKNIRKLIEDFPSGYKEEPLDLTNIRKPGEMAAACQHCTNGYKGRIGVFEVFEVDDEVEQVFKEKGGITALQEMFKKQDLPFMKDDGLLKVLQGTTSLKELERVVGIQV